MLSHALLHFPYWGMASLLALPASVYHTQQNGPCFISLCFSALNYWLSESRLLWTWPFQFGGRETLFQSQAKASFYDRICQKHCLGSYKVSASNKTKVDFSCAHGSLYMCPDQILKRESEWHTKFRNTFLVISKAL